MSYEKLEVYQLALEFLTLAFEIAAQIPPGYSDLADQLKRAAMSSVRNIGEGAGKRTPADCRKYFDIARGSAMESGTCLDVCRVGKLADPRLLDRGKVMLEREVKMLTGLSQAQGKSKCRPFR